ncbi:hypothetical protein BASA84_000102 [Batrachochytrium salamandrivorans]|nr:hypothetical protein BASA84_000102 [Batrachochytrium salamandrivorans]
MRTRELFIRSKFSADSGYIYSSSDDGHVLKWDWRAGTLLSTCMRHPSAVWSFDFNFGSPDIVVCGRADGHITVWNASKRAAYRQHYA